MYIHLSRARKVLFLEVKSPRSHLPKEVSGFMQLRETPSRDVVNTKPCRVKRATKIPTHPSKNVSKYIWGDVSDRKQRRPRLRSRGLKFMQRDTLPC